MPGLPLHGAPVWRSKQPGERCLLLGCSVDLRKRPFWACRPSSSRRGRPAGNAQRMPRRAARKPRHSSLPRRGAAVLSVPGPPGPASGDPGSAISWTRVFFNSRAKQAAEPAHQSRQPGPGAVSDAVQAQQPLPGPLPALHGPMMPDRCPPLSAAGSMTDGSVALSEVATRRSYFT